MIVVHVMHDEATSKYADYAEAAMKHLAAAPEQVTFERELLDSVYKSPSDSAARRHSLACQRAFAATERQPDAVHVISDSDCVVVRKGWDLDVARVLSEVDCFGTAYQDLYGRFVRSNNLQTYKKTPNVQWLALAPGKPWHLYSAGDKQLVENFSINTAKISDTFGLPLNYTLLTDTCWNIPVFLEEHGLSSLAMPNVHQPKLVSGSYEEWWLDGEPFVVHQGKSRKNSFRCTQFSEDFYKACDLALGYMAG